MYTNQKKARLVILISEKVNFIVKIINRIKRGRFQNSKVIDSSRTNNNPKCLCTLKKELLEL